MRDIGTAGIQQEAKSLNEIFLLPGRGAGTEVFDLWLEKPLGPRPCQPRTFPMTCLSSQVLVRQPEAG